MPHQLRSHALAVGLPSQQKPTFLRLRAVGESLNTAGRRYDPAVLDSFVYQYVAEAIVFGFGIYCGIRTGVLSPSDPRGRRSLILLCAGFLALFALQGAFLIWGK